MQIAGIGVLVGLVAQLAANGGALLTLRDAIAEALAKSPTLGAATDQVAAAGIDERRTKAAFAPNVSPEFRFDTMPSGATERSLGGTLTKQFAFGTHVSMNVVDRRTTSPADTSNPGYAFNLSQPLLRGFGVPTKAPLEQARRNVVGAERAELEARRDLVVAVAAAYLDALQADRVVAEAERALARAELLRRSSTARVSVGLSTELDISRADWLASQSAAVLLDARDHRTDARDRLNRLLGRPIDASVTLPDADLAQPATLLDAFEPPSPASSVATDDRLAALVAMALASRADVHEVRDRVHDAERSERVARWNLLPQLNLELGYAHAGLVPASITAPAASLVSGWRLGLSSDYSLNRAAASATAATAAIGVRAAARSVQQAELQIAEEVRRADRDWSRAAAAIDLQTKAVAMAERQLRLAQIRYERGVAGNFDVTDAENNLYQANTALVAAQAARALAGLTLRRAVGALDPEAVR